MPTMHPICSSNVRFSLRSLSAIVFALGALTQTALAQTVAPAQPEATPPAAATPAPATAPVFVAMTTSKGVIYLELNPQKAPLSVENFVGYVNSGFYTGTIFHRVMKNFMIQGGGFNADLKQKANNPPIKNEWRNGLPNSRGSISMARTPVADSATSQFFINTVDNKMLDQPRDGAAYAVFGKVIKGMDVVDAIEATPTGQSNGMGDVPKTPIKIEMVKILSGPPALDTPEPTAPPAVAPATPAQGASAGAKTP